MGGKGQVRRTGGKVWGHLVAGRRMSATGNNQTNGAPVGQIRDSRNHLLFLKVETVTDLRNGVQNIRAVQGRQGAWRWCSALLTLWFPW